ncbi:hypothetical protein DAPPUDRAFT_107854 [Daphnia pulex]|uniref:Uncharacterized protein n=1 Tax=Daphnia pulex TaxID=6669 RepID=E9GYG0_DAPPU|nr:hypothetical protein DAPPUDRAFT_107854 [Daphnia pulex]|eukprot:EFX75380.1 hypothetical protein DAPPUDRAFT_107854 [Daphnia pulex]
METPNGVDQPLAFDFSRKCELNPDGRQQLVLPKCRVAASSRSNSATRAPGGSTPVSYSMPTTPEMSETSPSPRQVSAGFFRFPFVGNNASPRRFRSRAMSAESNSEDIGPSVVVVGGSSSPPSDGFAHHHHQSAHEHPDPSLPVQAIQQTDKRLRFPRFLRRTHSASASTEAPPYALFLRTKRLMVLHTDEWSAFDYPNKLIAKYPFVAQVTVFHCTANRQSSMRILVWSTSTAGTQTRRLYLDCRMQSSGWVYAGRSLQRHHSSSRVYTDAVA